MYDLYLVLTPKPKRECVSVASMAQTGLKEHFSFKAVEAWFNRIESDLKTVPEVMLQERTLRFSDNKLNPKASSHSVYNGVVTPSLRVVIGRVKCKH